jgi:serine/threonine protein kinase
MSSSLYKIGEGAYSEVFYYEKYGLKYAVKKIKTPTVDILRESLGEILLTESLVHDNIPRFVSKDNQSEVLVVVSEYSELGDLFEFIENSCSALTINHMISDVALDISAALSYLHDLYVIHKDVKLENILVSRNRRKTGFTFRLCDFGLSCFDVSTVSKNEQGVQERFYKIWNPEDKVRAKVL